MTSIMDADSREERLPQWVKQQLAVLRMRLGEAKTRIAELSGDIPDTDTVEYAYPDERPLPKGAVIRFKLGVRDRQWVTVRVRRDGEGTYLEVMGGGGLKVRPAANNVAYVEVEQ